MVCDFINKFRESSNILKSELSGIKRELNYECINNDTSTDYPEFNEFKSEPDDDDDEKTLAELLNPLKRKLKKINVAKNNITKAKSKTKKLNENETNNIASSILEGNFSWTGQKWW